jgi:hypothetical protein
MAGATAIAHSAGAKTARSVGRSREQMRLPSGSKAMQFLQFSVEAHAFIGTQKAKLLAR